MTSSVTCERRQVAVSGIVQGVGFRPFVYALAQRYGLSGAVWNDAGGVQIEIEGEAEDLDRFLEGLEHEAPPLAVPESVRWQTMPARGDRAFRIEHSRGGAELRALISPDVAICTDCLAELFDSDDRRYRYPFINCTNCGPRFTIIRSVPYDRAMTTMAGFSMCPLCRSEYDDPANRRFHAQPNACPECGPRVRLADRSGRTFGGGDPIGQAAALLREGAVLAVKGLGGYHLACDPCDRDAVRALRGRKARQDKPFALMARDVDGVQEVCLVDAEEAALLTSPARPIVLLQRRGDARVAEEVAPRQQTLGVMLAYTPLHHLLLNDVGHALVMTSGNRSDEPIAYVDEEAFEQLGGIADLFLVHDRPIHMRCDDTVARVVAGAEYPIRRSRGYAPVPVSLPDALRRQTLACGAELKNTFCVAKERRAFLSHHIGNLENYETFRSFKEGIGHFCRLFDVQPEVVAYDLHPEYLSTKYAAELEEAGIPAVGVQHHHAHIASCLVDNGRPLKERAIGVAFDGTGYGTDGAIWGGEFFTGSVAEGFRRDGHLEYVPLPGGEAAIKQPWRMAAAHLIHTYGEDATLGLPLPAVRRAGDRETRNIARLLRTGLNAPPTSSAGRLFDAVSALLGLPGSDRTTYEGQAAIELELAVDDGLGSWYPFALSDAGDGWVVETREIIAGVVEDLRKGCAPGEIAGRFHRTMAEIVLAGCLRIREAGGPSAVALSGGTFQNMLLLEKASRLLEEHGFVVHRHRCVPANDGGVSLGQVALADGAFSRMAG